LLRVDGERRGEETTSQPACRGTPADLSLDQLVRPLEQRRRDREPERIRGLEVDHQLELRGLLDGEVGRLGAFDLWVMSPPRFGTTTKAPQTTRRELALLT
jgi:hypothetical protein